MVDVQTHAPAGGKRWGGGGGVAAGNSFQSLNILDSFNLKWIACDERDEVYITGFDVTGGRLQGSMGM